MKRIAYVIPTFPVPSETFITNELEAMAARGHQLFPCTLQFNDAVTDNQLQPLQRLWFARVQPLQQIRLIDALWTGVRVGQAPAAWQFINRQCSWLRRSLWLAAMRLASWVRRHDCQHIHAHFAQASAQVAIVAARFCGCTVSFVGHGADVYQHPFDLPLKLASADLTIAVCRDMQQRFDDHCGGVESVLIPCGIDTGGFQVAPAAKATKPVKPKAQRLLFVGRLVEKKGVDLLLQALATLNKGRHNLGKSAIGLDVVGTGPELEPLRTQAQGLDVNFLGYRDQHWLQSHGHNYLALVAPFRIARNGDRDTGPLVCKEAMAMGLPVITTNIMGLPEIVDSRCGWVVPPEDCSALCNALQSLLSQSPSQRRRLGLNGRRKVERLFTCERQAKLLSEQIEALA